MTVSLTTRLGLHRWSVDTDPWDREHFDADNAALEALAIIGTQGTNAERPTAGVQRRLYLATDAERVYLDDGDEWLELPVLSTANTWTGAQTFDDVEVGGTFTKGGLTVATTTDVGAVSTALGAHLADTSDAHDASAISFAPAGDVAATDVQAAIAELATEKATSAALTAHIDDTSDAHDASAISYAGSTDLVATTVEAALDELDTEKLAKAGGTTTGLVTFGAGLALTDGQDVTVGTGTGSKIGQTTSKLGFFGSTPAARPGTYNLTGSVDRTLGAYASDAEGTPYSTDPAALTDALTKVDGNALRAAYENLRVYVEDLAGIVIGTATDLKTLGLVG